MELIQRLRLFLFKILREKNVERLRYLKFSYKFSKFLKYKEKLLFVRKFSDFYEPEMALIPKILNSPRIIVDVGANYGPYSFFLSKLYPRSKIFAFEPATRSMNIFKKIIRKFKLNNVIPVKRGLGSKEEEKEICMPKQYTILAYVAEKNVQRKKEDAFEKIEITTLDNFVKRNKINNLDFIKCDVEGFELEVFKGAKKAIKKFRPIVFVEIEERHTKKYRINPQEVLNFFKKLKYFCYAVTGSSFNETDLITKNNPLYLFSPKKIKINQ